MDFKNKGKKIGVILILVALCIILGGLGAAIGFDSWIYTPPASQSEYPSSRWMVGLWGVCIQPTANSLNLLKEGANCTTIELINDIYGIASREKWRSDLMLGAGMSLLMSAATIFAAGAFFLCAFLPESQCRMVGLGGLPAAILTSGAFQISLLVMVSFVVKATSAMEYGVSFYLAVVTAALTWITGVSSLVIICRTS